MPSDSSTRAPVAELRIRSRSRRSSCAIVDSASRSSAPRVGKLQLLVAVGEQRHAVIALEVRDVLRHRRLRDVQLLSGARVVHRSANGQKRFDTEIQHCDLYQDKQ